jgi:hypothetical protein
MTGSGNRGTQSCGVGDVGFFVDSNLSPNSVRAYFLDSNLDKPVTSLLAQQGLGCANNVILPVAQSAVSHTHLLRCRTATIGDHA